MIRYLVAVWLALCAVADMATAQTASGPVVVELFTSQGCSSCPPADAFLTKLAAREDVLPLALHVDYWDYIGWPDAFASPAHTKRQKSYARAAGRNMIYTPQMIVGGEIDVPGNDPMAVMDAVAEMLQEAPLVAIATQQRGLTIVVTLSAMAPLPRGAVVQVVRYTPQARVAIQRGENAGRTIDYANIVTGWTQVADWDGSRDRVLEVVQSGSDPEVLIVQEPGHGRILAAARLR